MVLFSMPKMARSSEEFLTFVVAFAMFTVFPFNMALKVQHWLTQIAGFAAV
jgi:hypothetical protein